MRGKAEKISKNTKETSLIAENFLRELLRKNVSSTKALVVGLSGNLGAGKTTFVQAVARHLGIKNKINSPTFLIIKKYPVKNKKYKFLFHLDAYRLKGEKELFQLGWEEIIGNKEHLVFIEWPERVSKAVPPGAKFVRISHGEKEQRKFKIDPV